MKAICKIKPGRGFDWQDIPMPQPQDNEVLIQVKKTSICGTDLHLYLWDDWAKNTIALPICLGHEFMGTIQALGKSVTEFKKGDRVTGEGHLNCGKCKQCRTGLQHLCLQIKSLGIERPGAFAEYLCLPADHVIPLPDAIPDEVGAILDPFGNAVHTVLTLQESAEAVLITGAGPIGLMAVMLLKQIGAKEIIVTDVNHYRLKLAKQLGADQTIHTQEQTFDPNNQFYAGLEMSGQEQAIQLQIRALQPGGNLALLGIASQGITLDWNQIIFKGLTLKGIYGRKIFETWYQVFSFLSKGLDLKTLITHRFPAQAFDQAFKLALSGEAGKIILEW